MSLPLPNTLSPTKVSTFKSCALAFRFSAVDRLPQPPTEATVRGNLVHLALEKLFSITPAAERSPEVAEAHLDAAWSEMSPEIALLGLADQQQRALMSQATKLVRACFELEDPRSVEVKGVELTLQAKLGEVTVRGIIDRLDLEPDGSLTVTDYKTGRPPSGLSEATSLMGVNFYALLCEEALGVRPQKLQLYYLREPLVITATPSDQALSALKRQTSAIWSAVVKACEREDFRPRPSALCSWCAWKAYCPAFGGLPERARDAIAQNPSVAPLPVLSALEAKEARS